MSTLKFFFFHKLDGNQLRYLHFPANMIEWFLNFDSKFKTRQLTVSKEVTLSFNVTPGRNPSNRPSLLAKPYLGQEKNIKLVPFS